jgi:chorismate-pyruvate lyase
VNFEQAASQLVELIGLFYSDSARLGRFALASRPLPAGYSELLDHSHHMTVATENFFGQSVAVEVIESHRAGTRYWRKIVLRGERDRRVVLFGLVRLELSVLPEDARQEIESRSKPLGRVLIDHDILREVQLLDLWHVWLGEDLQRCFESSGRETFGRTALIHCDGQPAVELLEVITPEIPRTPARA